MTPFIHCRQPPVPVVRRAPARPPRSPRRRHRIYLPLAIYDFIHARPSNKILRHHHYRSHRLLLEVVPSTHISDRILYSSLCSTWGVEWVSEQLANLACIMWVETGGFNWVPDPHTQIRNLRVRGCILLAPMGVRPCLMMLLIRGPTTEEKPTTDFTGQTIVPEIACAGILNYSYVKGVKIQKTTDLVDIILPVSYNNCIFRI